MPIGIYKREPYSEEYRNNMSQIAKKKGFGKWMKGKKHSLETILKMSEMRKGKLHPMYGKKHSLEIRAKISLAGKGREVSLETRKKMSKSHRLTHGGNKHPLWKGDDVSYAGLHYWVRRYLGKPLKCEECSKNFGRIEWASKDGLYVRKLSEWIALCKPCHAKYDNVAQKVQQNRWGIYGLFA